MRKYHGTISDINNVTWTIELWDSPTVSGSSIELEITGSEFEYQGNDEMPFGLRPSSFNVGFSCVTKSNKQADLDTKINLQNIALDEEQKWAIKVLKNGSFYWAGRVLADQIHYGYSDKYGWIINLKAVDCLNLVEGYFVDPTWFTLNTNTRQTAIVLIASILDQTGLIDYFPSDVYADAIQITNASFPASNIGKTLAFTTLNKASFIDNFDVTLTSDKIKYIGCKEALENILKPFGARMMLTNGLYFITQPDAYQGSSFGYTTYGSTGALNTYNTTLSHQVANAFPVRPTWEVIPDISYQKPIRGIEIQWDKQNYQSAQRLYASRTTSELTFTTTDIDTGGTLNGKTIKVVFDLEFDSGGSTGSGFDFNIKLYTAAKSGSTYYTWNEVSEAWDNRGTSKPWHTIKLTTLVWKSGKQYYRFEQEIGEPPSGYSLECNALIDKVITVSTFSPSAGTSTWSAAGTFAWAFGGKISISQAYGSTDPRYYVYPEKYVNNLTGVRATNSTYLEYAINYYNATSLKDVGGLMVFNGTTYVVPGNWSVSWHSDAGDISKVLAANITGLYTDFLKSINGTWHDAGNYHAAKSLYFDSKTWILNGGKFTIANATWSGEWLNVDTDYTLYSSDGSGERTVQKGGDTLKDKVLVLEKSVADMRALFGVLGKGVIIPDIINNATGAPTSDPGANKQYALKLDYDYTNVVFNYKVDELDAESKSKSILLKPTDQTVNNSDSLADDTDLQFSMKADTVYNINIRVYFDTTAAADFKWGMTGPASPTLVRGVARHFNPGGTTEVVSNFVAYVSSDSITGSGTTGGWLWVNMTVQNGSNAGTFKFQWSQNTATVADTKVLAGSILEYVEYTNAVEEYLLMETGDYLLLETSDYIILD